jgi:putative ABC transport system permease protein
VIPSGLLRTGVRDLVRRPLHTGLMVLGVALGVSVVVAIDLANTAARRGFARSSEAALGRATHQVRGGSAGLPEEVYRRLRVDHGVRPSAPVVEGVVTAVDLGRQPLRVLGIDPLAEAPFRGHLGEGKLGDPAFAAFFTDPAAVLVGGAFAERHGLAPGSPLRVQAGDRRETLRVLGLVETADPDSRGALDGVLLLDVAAAQRLLGMPGRLSHVDLILTDAEPSAACVARWLPPGARVVKASEQADSIGQLSAAFELNLTALSLLALVVGMFLVYNTVLFGVVQRRAVFGTLRTLGTTPGQLFRLILAETLLTAAAGSVLGLVLGYVLGQSAVRLVTRTINDLYYVVSVSGAPVTLATAAKGGALGLGAALVAALAPALEAARVEPVTALRPSSFETRARRLVPRLALVGLAVSLLGAAGLALATHSLVASFAGLFGVVLGIALVAPGFTVELMTLLRPLASRTLGPIGRLACGTVARAVSRTGVAAAALMVAVSVTIGVGVMIASFRSTVANWLELTLRADVYVSAPSPGGARAGVVLSADVPGLVAAVPGVAEVETVRLVQVPSPLGEVRLAVTDATRARSASLYRVSEGDPQQIWQRVQAGAVLVSEPFAFRHRVPARGGSVALRSDRGLVEFPVAGIYYDYAAEQGTVMLTREVYERHWDDRARSSVAAYVAPGHDPAAVTDAVRRALAGRALQVVENRALRRAALRIFDRTFAVTEALRVLAVVVAFIGVWSALLALQVERTRELGTLLALGLLPRQLWGLTLVESGLIGLAAGLLSLPTGLALAVILIEVINVRSFGWTMQLELPPLVLVQALAVSVLAALLAAVYPVRRLQRMSVAAALRQE